MTRSMGDATRSNLTWALEVMAKEYPSRSDYSVELGWNLMVTRQFDNAEEILQVKVRLKYQEQVKPSNPPQTLRFRKRLGGFPTCRMQKFCSRCARN